jgi:DNA-binding CsgD family transcriptional regulator
MEALRDPRTITVRQKQVIQLIAEGRSNEEVGRELGISPRTAKAHCDTLRLKLGVPRRRQIRRQGLTVPRPRRLAAAGADSSKLLVYTAATALAPSSKEPGISIRVKRGGYEARDGGEGSGNHIDSETGASNRPSVASPDNTWRHTSPDRLARCASRLR